jgi:glutamate dehydrogenase/leucine dehydrogenase
VATGAGTQVDEGGFDVAALGDAWAEAGDGMVKSGPAKPTPAWSIFTADTDLLFIGSKAGALGHDGADGVKAKGVVPIGPVPFTTKALLTLQRASVTVVPDFVALAGPHLAAQGGVADPAAAAKATTEGISEVVQAASSHEDGLFLGACQRAEDFLRTWQDALPFGRPLA